MSVIVWSFDMFFVLLIVSRQALGLKKPPKPLLSECQDTVTQLKREFKEKMASFD